MTRLLGPRVGARFRFFGLFGRMNMSQSLWVNKKGPQHILVTGSAGFIGFHLCRRLLDAGHRVTGLDNYTEYYDVRLKKDRVALLDTHEGFTGLEMDISHREAMEDLFKKNRFDRVVNLAAQAGVRYSLENPHAYVDSNVLGFLNILEGCRHSQVPHLVFASSSSVYGLNSKMPFSVNDNVDHPISMYAATKKSNELMAHTYSYLYGLPVTGLRFFTVYGPWGRPDMALFLFTKAIKENRPIKVFNHGRMERDFTYIADIIEGVTRILDHVPEPDSGWDPKAPNPGTSPAPYRLYNIGNNNPVRLITFIETLEKALGREASKEYLPIQPGDVTATYADVTELEEAVSFKPRTPLEQGIQKFIEWYNEYYG